jgi:hypothetical protein
MRNILVRNGGNSSSEKFLESMAYKFMPAESRGSILFNDSSILFFLASLVDKPANFFGENWQVHALHIEW